MSKDIAELSEAELEEAVAREVLGHNLRHTANYIGWSTSIASAMEAVEAARKAGIDCEMKTATWPGGSCWVLRARGEYVRCSFAELPAAIARCLLAAVRAKKGGQ